MVPEQASPPVADLRRFNRTVTERVGALNERYLARDRSLGASRLLWEIDAEGTSARSLRERLNLDSGYLSRLLRSLEAEGLIETTCDPTDRRRRVIVLTDRGNVERNTLDTRSDELATTLLEPLSDGQRARLVEAANTVERLLTVGLIEIDTIDPRHRDAVFCIDCYFTELDRRFDGGFDPERSISAEVDELTEPNGLLLVARLRGEPVGCGALKFSADGTAEIKRMWVADSARGLGLGRRILAALETRAAERGASTVRLETNRSLAEAIALYRSAGYTEVDAFNEEVFAHHWFEKRLNRPGSATV